MKKPKVKKIKYYITYSSFYQSEQWKLLKEIIFKFYPRQCFKCKSTNIIQVDHIKPKSIFPKDTFNIMNLQPLCSYCNKEKSNKNYDNYRTVEQIDGFKKYLMEINFDHVLFAKENQISGVFFDHPSRKIRKNWKDLMLKHDYFETNIKIGNRDQIERKLKNL